MIFYIHPRINLQLEVLFKKNIVYLIPAKFKFKYKNVKRELGTEWTNKQVIWAAYVTFDWLGFEWRIRIFK